MPIFLSCSFPGKLQRFIFELSVKTRLQIYNKMETNIIRLGEKFVSSINWANDFLVPELVKLGD